MAAVDHMRGCEVSLHVQGFHMKARYNNDIIYTYITEEVTISCQLIICG